MDVAWRERQDPWAAQRIGQCVDRSRAAAPRRPIASSTAPFSAGGGAMRFHTRAVDRCGADHAAMAGDGHHPPVVDPTRPRRPRGNSGSSRCHSSSLNQNSCFLIKASLDSEALKYNSLRAGIPTEYRPRSPTYTPINEFVTLINYSATTGRLEIFFGSQISARDPRAVHRIQTYGASRTGRRLSNYGRLGDADAQFAPSR